MSKASLLELCHGEKKYEAFSISHEQSQTCLSYAECSRKSHVCKMYENS